MKTKDNHFEGALPHFLGEWEMNFEGTEPKYFCIHLFPEDLVDETVHNTNLCAPQNGKENLALARGEPKTFRELNMFVSYAIYQECTGHHRQVFIFIR